MVVVVVMFMVMLMIVVVNVVMIVVVNMIVIMVMFVVMVMRMTVAVIMFMLVIMFMAVIVVVVMAVIVFVMVIVFVLCRMNKHVKPGPCDPLPVGSFNQQIKFVIQSEPGQAVADRFRSRANVEQSAHEHVAADTGETVQIKDVAHGQFPLAFSIWRPIVAAR